MTTYIKVLIALFSGAFIASITIYSVFDINSTDKSEVAEKPLYWVAPMDPNYRRDKPGKSMMGMDLVPVYAKNASSDELGAGVVSVAPHVVNNFGIRTALVDEKRMNREISTLGYVQYNEDTLIHIHPRVDGWIETLFVKAEGDPVKKGQPLYTLYSPQLVNAQEEFVLVLKQGNKALIDATRTRLKALHLSSEFIRTLEKSKKVQQSVTFYAPKSGIIDGLKIREGFYVKPGNTLMMIAQLSHVWIEAEVFERDAALIAVGQPITMTLDYLPGKVWKSAIDYIYPALDVKTRTLRIRIRLENSLFELKPNMFAQVNIHVQQEQAALLVPKSSVIRTGQQNRVVMALGEGRFKSVKVDIGNVNTNTIEILSGLEAGDRIVTSAQFLLDSESSISSDFKRIDTLDANVVTVLAEINQTMNDGKAINVTHAPIDEWEWPEMTMDFNILDNVDVSSIEVGKHVELTLIKEKSGDIFISDIQQRVATASEEFFPNATVDGVILAINNDTRVVSIQREAIDKWDRPEATMEFMLGENIDISALFENAKINFTFEVRNNLIVTRITLKDVQVNTHSGH